MKFNKKFPHVGQMGNFGPIVGQNYASLYLKIHCKEFF